MRVRRDYGDKNCIGRNVVSLRKEKNIKQKILLAQLQLKGIDIGQSSLSALEGWYYGQILRGEPLYPPAYGKVLTSAVTIDEVRRVLERYSYSVGYVVTARPGTEGKGDPDEE